MVSTSGWLLLTALLLSAAPASHALFGGRSKDTDQQAAPVDDRKYYWANTVTGKTQWEDPTPKPIQDANGNEYWVDPKTGESTWYMPEEFGWAPVDDKEVGRLFYHNSVTKESVWEKPEILAWQKIAMPKDDL
eukprot:jgi/Astpho2/931/fgenesh1_pg.00016_%23_122_t